MAKTLSHITLLAVGLALYSFLVQDKLGSTLETGNGQLQLLQDVGLPSVGEVDSQPLQSVPHKGNSEVFVISVPHAIKSRKLLRTSETIALLSISMSDISINCLLPLKSP
jgi:hypothetical protein